MCGLFLEKRDYDTISVEGLSDEENRTIKEIYRQMDITSKAFAKFHREIPDDAGIQTGSRFRGERIQKEEADDRGIEPPV